MTSDANTPVARSRRAEAPATPMRDPPPIPFELNDQFDERHAPTSIVEGVANAGEFSTAAAGEQSDALGALENHDVEVGAGDALAAGAGADGTTLHQNNLEAELHGARLPGLDDEHELPEEAQAAQVGAGIGFDDGHDLGGGHGKGFGHGLGKGFGHAALGAADDGFGGGGKGEGNFGGGKGGGGKGGKGGKGGAG